MARIKLTLQEGESIVNGKQITFKTPCDCEGITAVTVGMEEFELVNAAGTNISTIGNAFVKDAMVTVVLDTDGGKAYIQNPAADRPLDTRPTEGSVNLVTSGGVKAYVDDSINTAIMALPPELNTTYQLTKEENNIVLTGSDGSVTNIVDKNTTYELTKVGSIIKLVGSDGNETTVVDNNITYDVATQGRDGLLSATDKKKLDSIQSGATANTFTYIAATKTLIIS